MLVAEPICPMLMIPVPSYALETRKRELMQPAGVPPPKSLALILSDEDLSKHVLKSLSASSLARTAQVVRLEKRCSIVD